MAPQALSGQLEVPMATQVLELCISHHTRSRALSITRTAFPSCGLLPTTLHNYHHHVCPRLWKRLRCRIRDRSAIDSFQSAHVRLMHHGLHTPSLASILASTSPLAWQAQRGHFSLSEQLLCGMHCLVALPRCFFLQRGVRFQPKRKNKAEMTC